MMPFFVGFKQEIGGKIASIRRQIGHLMLSPLDTPEPHWLALLHAARAIDSQTDCLDALVGLAAHWIARGETQEGADVLAWVLRQESLSDITRETAQMLWDELAAWICPRVLLDAADFAQYATFDDICEYVSLPL